MKSTALLHTRGRHTCSESTVLKLYIPGLSPIVTSKKQRGFSFAVFTSSLDILFINFPTNNPLKITDKVVKTLDLWLNKTSKKTALLERQIIAMNIG